MKKFKHILLSTIILVLGFTSISSFAQSWTSIDGGGTYGISSTTSSNSNCPSVVVYNGELYATWQENISAVEQIHIKKYNGSTWTPVGNTAGQSQLNTNAGQASEPKITVYNGALYAAWNETGSGISNIRVKKYNGSSWTFVENYGIFDVRTNINNQPTASAKRVDICVYNNELYATWVEQANITGIDQVRVSKFNGSLWNSIDGNSTYGINYNTSRNAYYPTLCVFNNMLYIAWKENDASGVKQLRIKRYDGGNTWTFVDGNGATGLNYSTTVSLADESVSLSTYNGKMYAFWSESNKIRVKGYDGSNWTTEIDGGTGWNHNSAIGGYYPTCYSYDKLYVAWEQNPMPGQVRIVSFDGTTKTFIDGDVAGIGINNTTANGAHFPKLILYNGNLVAVWSEELTSTSGSANQIRAKIYQLSPKVNSVSVPANETYVKDQVLNFTVNFSKSVTVAGGTPYIPITLNTGGTVNATYSSGSGTTTLLFRYTVTDGYSDNDGISIGSSIVLPGGCSLRDANSLDASLTLNNVGTTTLVRVDGLAPTVSSINRQTPATTPTNATSLVYRITFSEPVTGVGTSDFTLITSGGATGGTIASIAAISESIYDVTVNQLLGYGTFRLDLNSSGTGIKDTNDNPISGGYTTSQTYTNTNMATLTTQAVSGIGSTNAVGNGNITNLGYPNPTAYGICYGTTVNPEITGSKVDKGAASATGAFTVQLTGLNPGTTYHARAFATNSAGTNYSTDVTFTTNSTLTEPGNALNFDGADDYVVATDNDNNLTAFTIEAWVKWSPTSTSDVNFICGKGVEQMEIHTGGGAGANGIRFIPTTGVYLDASNVLPVGVWTHVAVVYNPSALLAKMYINGVEVAIVNHGANPLGTAIANTALPFYLGTRGDASYRFKGSMDEVCVWNLVRSKAEIQADMNNSIGASSSGLINYYKFNEGTAGGNNTAGSTILPDMTSNGNNGTLNNFALTGTISNWVESGIVVVPASSTFNTNGNWSTASNWSDGLPGAITDVTINADCTLDDNFLANNITINSTATVTIPSGKTLILNGDLILKSDATGTASLINNGTLTVKGKTSVERYMTGDQWHMVSSPVSGQSITSFLGANALVALKPGTDIRGMKTYNETTNLWNELLTNTSPGNLGGGNGLTLWPSANGTVTFSGTLQGGEVNTTVVRNGTGWNCIGNPYSSAIAINTAAGATNFINLNSSNIDPSYGAIYVWEQGNNAYTMVSLSDAAYYAQAGQGFFVKAKSGSTQVNFLPNIQTHQTGVTLKSGTISWPEIKLTASMGTLKSTTSVRFNESMTQGLDFGYDAGIFKSGFDLYTRLVEDNGVDFGIQCLPLAENKEMVIPIGLESATEGTVVITTNISNMPSSYQVILEDRKAGIFISLPQNESTYTLPMATPSKITDRFYLHVGMESITANRLASKSEDWKVYAAKGQIHISGPVTGQATATLYDLTGREIRVYRLQKGSMNSIPSLEFKNGMYLLNIRQSDRSFTWKIPVQN